LQRAALKRRLELPVLRAYVKTQHREPIMSTGPNRIFDEFAKLMTDAAGAAQGLKREGDAFFRAQAERMMQSMDLVQREEFEAVREMAVKALAENEALKARIAAMEAQAGATANTEVSSAKPKKAKKSD
jgi:BMFP domain-containing protein YqiC